MRRLAARLLPFLVAVLAGVAQALAIATPWDGQPLHWWLQILAGRAGGLLQREVGAGRGFAGRAFATAWLTTTWWVVVHFMHTSGLAAAGRAGGAGAGGLLALYLRPGMRNICGP